MLDSDSSWLGFDTMGRERLPRGTGDIANGHHYLVAIHHLEPDDAAALSRTGHPSPRSS